MKINLHSATHFITVLLINLLVGNVKLHAQACTVSNITVKLNSSGISGANCAINIDLSWDQMNNSGNKFTNVHLWTSAAYPNPAISYASSVPTALQLANTLGTIVITNPTAVTPTLAASYPTAPSVAMLSASSVQRVYVSGSGNNAIYRFTVKGINLIIPGACTTSAMIKADLWSSNSASDNAIQCATAGASFIANDPSVSGLILCNNPRQFVVNLSTLGASSLQASYTVYADEAPFGTLDESDHVVYTSGTVTIPASGSGFYTSGPISFANTYSANNLWVRVQVTGFPNSTAALLTNSCGILPIKLTSFVANRTNSSYVSLKWETALEQNNKGFSVLRKDGAGNFQSVGFVASKAPGGNSSNALSYQFNDANGYSGETQYRLMQTDMDGKVTYSPIVLVRGAESSAMNMLIYPNPSYNGSSVLTFNSADNKDISIIDISGRVLLSAKSIGNSYEVKGIKGGIYFIKVMEIVTGKTITGKLIMK